MDRTHAALRNSRLTMKPCAADPAAFWNVTDSPSGALIKNAVSHRCLARTATVNSIVSTPTCTGGSSRRWFISTPK